MVMRNLLAIALVAAAAASLASCSSPIPQIGFSSRHSSEYFSEREYGRASPRVAANGEVPKGGGHVVIGDPYRVAGRTYIPQDNPSYSAVGLASWYGDAFHGRLTANVEVYDVGGLTAAHPTMPLPSYARVTNLQNGRSIVVRVNDRGPFAEGRIIDVSERVAGVLGFQDNGTARVKVDYVGPARMDGQDERMLMASYRAPDAGNTMFASNFTLPRAQTPTFAPRAPSAPVPQVVLASATSRPKPTFASAVQASATSAPMMIEPAVAQQPYTPAFDAADPLAPIIMQSGTISSYASSDHPTAAEQAVDVLAQPDALQAALNRAAAKKAVELGATREAATFVGSHAPSPVIQLGSFADADNAKRLAASFTRFGQVETLPQVQGGRTLTAVRVAVDPAVPQSAVIAAAQQAGLNGAFVISQ